MASSTQLWYIRSSTGLYVFQCDRQLDEGLTFVLAGVPSCSYDIDAPLVFEFQIKCEVADVNREIPIDLRSIKWIPDECDQPCRGNILWYIQSDNLVPQVFKIRSSYVLLQHLNGSCQSLWIKLAGHVLD